MDITTTLILNGLGWAIVHSLWQGLLAALFVIIVRSMTQDKQAALRCGAEIVALLGCFTAFIATFLIYIGSGAAQNLISFAPLQVAPIEVSEAMSTLAGTGSASAGLSIQSLANYTPLLGILWCLGFTLLSIRYAIALLMTHRLRTRGISPAPTEWQHRFHTLILNTGILRKVTLHISNRVDGPMTLGFFRPVVLVPASFFSGLPPAQIEAILLHEIAHIRRHDYLINLLQTAIKVILFYHPAIHYIAKCIDDDREQACDDFAVRYTNDPTSLAKGLANLRLHLTPPNFALAALPMRADKKPLLRRLQRLMKVEPSRRRPEHVVTSLAALMVAAGLYTTLHPNMGQADAHELTELPVTIVHGMSPEKGNYSFDTIEHNGRDITLKVTPNGERWFKIGNSWYDIDKQPEILAKVPMTPEAPVMPKPEDFNSYVKFEKAAAQYRVDLDYYIAALENAPTGTDYSKKIHWAEKQKRRVSHPNPDFDKDYLNKSDSTTSTNKSINRTVSNKVSHSTHVKTAHNKTVPAPAPQPEPMPELAGSSDELKSGVYINGVHIEDMDWSENQHELEMEALAEDFETRMEALEDTFETALDKFETTAEKYGENPEQYKNSFKQAEKEFAKTILKTNQRRDELTRQFENQVSQVTKKYDEEYRREYNKEHRREYERAAKMAARDAKRSAQQAERGAEQARRSAERAMSQARHEAKHAAEQALRDAEREAERMHRNAEKAVRAGEQAQRDLESVQRDAEKAQRHAERIEREETARNTDSYKTSMLNQLKSDNLIDDDATSAKILFKDGLVYVDGKKIQHHMEDNYCKVNKNHNIRKSDYMKVEITPTRLTITDHDY